MNTILKNKKIIFALIIVLMTGSAILYGNIDGRINRTLKSSAGGCGGCHGTVAAVDVGATISGPDTVIIGQTKQYTLTITRANKTGAGLDIATRNGVLAPISSNIHLSGVELTHNDNIPMTNGTVTVTFNYTAPASGGIDTLWATVLATNSDGSTSGDDWNWAPSKRIIIRSPLGIEHNQTAPADYRLSQNYPNPFNPSTKINFAIKENGPVSLVIYDIKGEEVNTLVNSDLVKGEYNLLWNGTDNNGNTVSSGFYIYKLTSQSFTSSKIMTLVK